MQYLVGLGEQVSASAARNTPTARTDFLGGKLATDCSFGIWGIPQMRDAKIDCTVKPAPRFAGSVSDERLSTPMPTT